MQSRVLTPPFFFHLLIKAASPWPASPVEENSNIKGVNRPGLNLNNVEKKTQRTIICFVLQRHIKRLASHEAKVKVRKNKQ